LRVLASSEVTDMTPILRQAAKATGVAVELAPDTTRAATTMIASGQAARKYDAAWLSTDRYLAMTPGGLPQLRDSNPIMSSPVIIGVRASVARQLGWDRHAVTWSAIAAAVAAHRFTFGMTDPASTNAGLSALAGVATAIAGDGGALHADQATQASPVLRELFAGQALKAASPADLARQYLRAQDDGDAQGGPVGGLIDYESDLVTLNASRQLREPLDLIYPADGVATADYPLSLLSSAAQSPGARAAYQRLVSYLLTPAVQRTIMELTHRRPADPRVAVDPGLRHGLVFELPFPASLGVLDSLVGSYYGTLRRPARTVYLIDISQPMAGTPLASLKAALGALTGATAGPATAFQAREQITFQPFATAAYPPATFDIPPRDPQHERDLVRAYIASQAAGGSSAIYDALTAAYRTITAQAATDPDRITTIVLLTAGRVTAGSSQAAFDRFYRSLPPTIASVPVFPVLFAVPGAASTAPMGQLAALTGGQAFSASHLQLATILTLIRENQ
jgi:Ca-activated chloride channel family protein